jgi:hypothetical protein
MASMRAAKAKIEETEQPKPPPQAKKSSGPKG